MSELISQTERKARKEHICEYCGEKILRGEKYLSAFLKDGGDVWQWKTHLHCDFIANELWRYINPTDGMQQEHFQEGCTEFCTEFVCPRCEFYKDKKCEQSQAYCLDKIDSILKDSSLLLIQSGYCALSWRLVPRKKEEN